MTVKVARKVEENAEQMGIIQAVYKEEPGGMNMGETIGKHWH